MRKAKTLKNHFLVCVFVCFDCICCRRSVGFKLFVLFLNREKFAGEKIPTLEEAVEECVRLQLTIYFDVKGHPDEVMPANCCVKYSPGQK